MYRSLLDDPVWMLSTPEQKVVLITLLTMANHSSKQWEWLGEKFEVLPGQFITSIDSIKSKAGKNISSQNVRTSLKRFEKLGFLTNKSTKTGRLITVVNWAFYQDENSDLTKQVTKTSQRANKDLTPNKNDKNDKEENTTSSGSDGNSKIEQNFELLWKLYPRKEGKDVARKAYKRAIKNGATNKAIQDGIVAYRKLVASEGRDKQYIRQGGTWFNQKGWEDEYQTEMPVDTSEPQDDGVHLSADQVKEKARRQREEFDRKYLAEHPKEFEGEENQ